MRQISATPNNFPLRTLPDFSRWIEPIFLFCIISLASILIFTGLGNQSLWIDEAHTAFLAKTILTHGVPKGFDALNTVALDISSHSSDMTATGTWIITPWLPYYLIAPLTKLDPFTSEAVLRTPFALFGLATILFSYFLSKRFFGMWTARVTAIFFLFFVPFLLYSRECRYYSMAMFFSVWLVYGYDKFLRGENGVFLHTLIAQALLFHTNYLIWVAMLSGIVLHFFLIAYDKRKLSDLLFLLLWSTLFHLPWIMLFKSKAAQDLVSWDGFIDGVGDFLLKTNNNLIPFSLILIWYYTVIPKEKRSLAILWKDRGGSIEKSRVLLIFFLLIANVFAASISKFHFFRYLSGAIPFAIMGKTFLSLQLFSKKKVLGIALIIALALTDFLAFPFKFLAPPTIYSVSKDQKRTFLPVLDRSHWPFFDYIRSITQSVQDPTKAILLFLRDRAKPGEKVVTNTGVFSLMYYLPQLEVNGGVRALRTGILLDENADWLIPRPSLLLKTVVTQLDGTIRKKVMTGRYHRFELDMVDRDQNIPEPDTYIYDWTRMPYGSRVEIYQRADRFSQATSDSLIYEKR